MRRSRISLILATGLLVITACGGDDDSASADDAASDAAEPADEPAAQSAEQPADEPAAESTDESTEEPAEEPAAADSGGGGGQGSAVLTLDNGESYEFSILCALEPQMAAGSEILFTVVSYDDVGLDITQFGDEGTVTGFATISVYDASYETMWEAASLYDAFGGTIELSLDGSTVNGSGSFYPAGDPTLAPVDGQVTANC